MNEQLPWPILVCLYGGTVLLASGVFGAVFKVPATTATATVLGSFIGMFALLFGGVWLLEKVGLLK